MKLEGFLQICNSLDNWQNSQDPKKNISGRIRATGRNRTWALGVSHHGPWPSWKQREVGGSGEEEVGLGAEEADPRVLRCPGSTVNAAGTSGRPLFGREAEQRRQGLGADEQGHE